MMSFRQMRKKDIMFTSLLEAQYVDFVLRTYEMEGKTVHTSLHNFNYKCTSEI